jgi:hypothetical protein
MHSDHEVEAGYISQSLDKRKRKLLGIYEAINGDKIKKESRTWAAQLSAIIP